MTIKAWMRTRRGQFGSGVIAGTVGAALAKKSGYMSYANKTKNAKVKRVTFKLKGGGSKVTVKSNHSPISRDGPVSKSFFHFRLKKIYKIPKGFKSETGTQFYLADQIAKGSHATNSQLSTNVASMYNGVDLIAMYNAALSMITDSTRHANSRIFLEQCTQRTMITNQTNDVVRLAIYDIVPRKDINSSTYSPPTAAWTQGIATSGASTTSVSFVGANPFQSPVFTKLYKVQKVTNLELHSGGHHVHTTVSKPRRMIDGQYLSENGANSYSGYGGLTCWTMCVQHGFPLNDGTTKTNIGTASGAIDYVTTRQYKYRIFSTTVSDYRLATTTLVDPGTQSLMNDLVASTTTISTA